MHMDETALIQMFVAVTGDTETAGRSVVMYLEILERDYFPNLNPNEAAAGNRDERSFGIS